MPESKFLLGYGNRDLTLQVRCREVVGKCHLSTSLLRTKSPYDPESDVSLQKDQNEFAPFFCSSAKRSVKSIEKPEFAKSLDCPKSVLSA